MDDKPTTPEQPERALSIDEQIERAEQRFWNQIDQLIKERDQAQALGRMALEQAQQARRERDELEGMLISFQRGSALLSVLLADSEARYAQLGQDTQARIIEPVNAEASARVLCNDMQAERDRYKQRWLDAQRAVVSALTRADDSLAFVGIPSAVVCLVELLEATRLERDEAQAQLALLKGAGNEH